MTHLLGWSVVLFGYAVLSSVSVMIHRLTMHHVSGILLCSVLLPFIFSFLYHKVKRKRDKGVRTLVSTESCSRHEIFGGSSWFMVVYLLLWAAGVALLVGSTSDVVLRSPWQAIHHVFPYVFFFASIVFGIILFSRYKVPVILFTLILHTFLLHLFVPLSHVLPWGGDVWRHIAMEERVVASEYIHPVLIGDTVEMIPMFGVQIPRLFSHPQKLGYSMLWGMTSFIQYITGLSFEIIHICLVPLLFSFMVPVLLFRLGAVLFGTTRRGLWLAAASLILYPIQAAGSLTVPVSLGFVFFLFVLTIWATYLRYGYRYMRWMWWVTTALLFFGYSLYAVLGLLLLVYTYAYRYIKGISSLWIKRSVLGIGMGLSIFVIPVFEWLAGTWQMGGVDILREIKQILGQWSGLYYISQIRDHDISSGNMLINQTPLYAYVETVFTVWRWWILGVLSGVYASVFVAMWFIIKDKIDDRWRILLWFGISLFGGYLIGWHLGGGDRAIIRRLDLVLGLLIVLFACYGWVNIMDMLSIRLSRVWYKVVVMVSVLFVILLGVQTYISGPDEYVLHKDSYDAARIVATELEWENPQCIIADTWELLALERFTHAYIIGGGFPMVHGYGQPERVRLYHQLTSDFVGDELEVAHELTGDDSCVFITSVNNVDVEGVTALFGSDPERVGGVFIWRED